jgi:hypothetical protein
MGYSGIGGGPKSFDLQAFGTCNHHSDKRGAVKFHPPVRTRQYNN